jgi:hypothetical protein
MKKLILSIVLVFIFLGNSKAQFGIFASATYINTNGTSQFYNTTDLQPDPNAIGTLNLQNANFGTYTQNSNSLSILGAEIKTFKNTNGNVCSGDMYYTVYPVGNRPVNPFFNDVPLAFYDDCSGGAFPTGGPCSAGDQKWRNISQAIDLTNNTPGTYTLELYYQANGTNDGTCGDFIVYDNNNTNPVNYTATFTISSITPVTLQSFTAAHYNNAALLKWTDDNEINNKGFEIERSVDGKNFSDIGWQDSKDASTNIYNYTDNSLLNVSEVFYRLKMIDNDGSFKYSIVIPVNLSVLMPLTVQSNGNELTVHVSGLTQGNYSLQLFSFDGKLTNAKSLKVSGSNTSATQSILISTNNFAKGVMIITLRDVAGNLLSKTNFVK